MNEDQTIMCIGCNRPFTFSVGEQEFYARRDFQPPKRCPACRAKRKQEERKTGYR